jgi:hypothetical protein
MATRKAAAPPPRQIRRKAFDAALKEAKKDIASSFEDWIRTGRAKDSGNVLLKERVIFTSFGGPEREFEKDVDAAMTLLAGEYTNAGWTVKVTCGANSPDRVAFSFEISDE